MKYNPDNHHRRSIRLPGYDYSSPGAYFITICTHQRQCLFGEIVDGEMQLHPLGQMVNSCWQRLPFHFPHLALDAFVVMPNHIHGILVLTNSGRGAALGQHSEHPTNDAIPNATPPCDRDHPNFDRLPAELGVAFGRELIDQSEHHLPNAAPQQNDRLPAELGVAFGQTPMPLPSNHLPNAAPLPPRLGAGTVGAIVLNFKSVTTRSGNRIRRSPGSTIWQRNYYEHVIRSEESLCHIRQYIHHNPLLWQQDQLHPGNPSKW